MPAIARTRAPRAQPSSMHSFLGDYQLVRMVAGVSGLLTLAILGLFVGYAELVAYILGLAVTAAHAIWARVRQVAAPKSLLAIDTTVWGSITVITNDPVTGTAMLALLFVFIAAFSDGAWRAGFLLIATTWYGISFFEREGSSIGSLGRFVGVLLIVGALAGIMARIRLWLGRLEAGRSQLLGTVSHELRNNLTGLMGLTDIVSTDTSLAPQEATELVALAHQQAMDAAEIVEDLLTATRLEGSALSVGVEVVDVNREIEAMMRRFSSEGLDLSVDSYDDLPRADADALRVRQILRNLVSNAVRYGGTSIRIATAADSDHIEITVADNGGGVPADYENTMFLPYRRSLDPRHASSVGLGLWISRSLAQAMGGSLDYGRVDGWTEFTLALPVHRETTTEIGHRAAVRQRRLLGRTTAHGDRSELTHRRP